jgi:hypothetical protein
MTRSRKCATGTRDHGVPDSVSAGPALTLETRARLDTENLVLGQQLIVQSHQPRARVRLRNTSRFLFVWRYRLFPSILNAITMVEPDTVIRWHQREAQEGPRGASSRAWASGARELSAGGRWIANCLVPPSFDMEPVEEAMNDRSE